MAREDLTQENTEVLYESKAYLDPKLDAENILLYFHAIHGMIVESKAVEPDLAFTYILKTSFLILSIIKSKPTRLSYKIVRDEVYKFKFVPVLLDINEIDELTKEEQDRLASIL